MNVESGILIKMAAAPDIKKADSEKGIKIQRASLDYIASICQ